jgi:hypothetical protein
MDNVLRVVYNPTEGGQKAAVYLPDAMATDEWQKWMAVERNRRTLRKAKKELLNSDDDEVIVEVFPVKVPAAYKRTKAKFIPDVEKNFLNKLRGLRSKHVDLIMFKNDDPAWDSGFVEYLIDRYHYRCDDAFTVVVFLDQRREEDSNG